MLPPPPPPDPEERVCVLCDTELGHLPLNSYRTHIEHCLSTPDKDAVPAIPGNQTQTHPPDLTPDPDTDATLTDDELQDRDLPPPYGPTIRPLHPHAPTPSDPAATTTFSPLTQAPTFLTALTHPASRSTRALHTITHNAQTALQTWQDEYLHLEHALTRLTEHKPPPRPHPRRPLDPLVFEDRQMAGLYGFKHDAHESRVGAQDPFAALRRGRVVGGKMLRDRKPRVVGGGVVESEDEGAGRRVRRGGGWGREGSETGGSRAVSVVGGGVAGRKRRGRDEETLSSDAAGPLLKRGRPRLYPLLGSRLRGLDGRGGGTGTTGTSEATTEAEMELETEEGGTPAPGVGLGFASASPSAVAGRLNLLEAKRRGRKPKLTAAAGAVGRLPGLAEEGPGELGGPPQKEKKRKGRPPGVFGKYWAAEAKKLKLKSQLLVDSGADS